MSIAEAAAAVRAGELTSTSLVTACHERADALDALLGTYLTRFDETALQAGHAIDTAAGGGTMSGPLAGIPLAVKDFIAAREGPTTAQSVVHDPDWFRGRDARVVQLLRDAGAVILGKTTMAEHAAGRPDPVMPFPILRNPWDIRRWTGGSSTGTANGIAAGLFPAGLGTDTSGSVRIPAAMCGISGLRPTTGRVPMSGCLPASRTLDVIGPMARTAGDLAALLRVIAPQLPAEPVPESPALDGIRVGVPWSVLTDPDRGIDPGCLDSFRQALADLESAGVTIVDFDLADEIDRLIATTMLLMTRELYEVHRQNLSARWEAYGRSLRRLAAAGGSIGEDAYAAAGRYARRSATNLAGRMAGMAAVATPTWPTGAPLHRAGGGMPEQQFNLTAAWSATGFPVLSVPMGFDDNAMPVSLQLAGAADTDYRLLRIGAAYQQRTDWHTRRPSPDPAAIPDPVPDPDEGSDSDESHSIEQAGHMLTEAAATLMNTP